MRVKKTKDSVNIRLEKGERVPTLPEVMLAVRWGSVGLLFGLLKKVYSRLRGRSQENSDPLL